MIVLVLVFSFGYVFKARAIGFVKFGGAEYAASIQTAEDSDVVHCREYS